VLGRPLRPGGGEEIGDVFVRLPPGVGWGYAGCREELPSPLSGGLLTLGVGVRQDRDPVKVEIPDLGGLRGGDPRSPDGHDAPTRRRDGEGVNVTFEQERLAFHGAWDEEWSVAGWELLGGG
jgi:hypothetical protein